MATRETRDPVVRLLLVIVLVVLIVNALMTAYVYSIVADIVNSVGG